MSKQNSKKHKAKARINPKRERIFRLFAFAIPVIFFLLLELTLRLFNYGGDLALFITAKGEYSKYYKCNPKVGKRYFFVQTTIPDPPNDLFLKQKPENSYRIFVMGGSTAAGYPYGNNVMFPRILQKRLEDMFPDRQIEVVNTAMTAVNTYTILDFMDEVLEQSPDAILIYSGHNEFYGALGAASNESLGRLRGFVKLYLKLQKFKTFLLLRNGIGELKNYLNKLLYKGDVRDPSATLMERLVGEQTIVYGDAIYEIGKRQFEENLKDICGKAKNAGVRVVLSELVSNIRDHRPFISVVHDSLPLAEDVFEQARKLEKRGNFEAAREKYERAKDLDGLRFRASEEFNQVIHHVAGEFGDPVVPMKEYFENN